MALVAAEAIRKGRRANASSAGGLPGLDYPTQRTWFDQPDDISDQLTSMSVDLPGSYIFLYCCFCRCTFFVEKEPERTAQIAAKTWRRGTSKQSPGNIYFGKALTQSEKKRKSMRRLAAPIRA